MSIATELQNYADGLDDAYDAVNDMSGIIPQHKNMNNLDQAIRTIPQNTGTTYTAGYGIDIDQNDEISVDTTVIAEKTDIPTNTSDLTNDGDDGVNPFVATDDYATSQTAGAVKVTSSFGVEMSNSGEIKGAVVSSANYPSMWNDALVSKGTLENALSTKSYATTSDIPTNTSDLTNDGSDGTSTYVEADDLATVATSGSYNDLLNTPTIPAAQVNSDWDAASGVAQILNKPSLATVATSGDYGDLLNKPTIPTVNDATLTIQKNGTTVDTFTANASSNKTVNITVPTSFSGLSGTVGSTQFADNTISRARINWSTFKHNFTATSDGNGFVPVPNTVVKPATGFILSVRCTNREAFTQVYNDAANKDRYTIKCESWNRQAVGNTSITLDIIYILLA